MAEAASKEKLRIDKWLWQARFFKTRGLAAGLAGSGRLRINREHVAKPAQPVRPGDVLTFPQGDRIRVIRIEALGARRGPAPEARALYTDLDEATPPPDSGQKPDPGPAPAGERETGAGRPTKKERREIDALQRDDP
ncbi:MAG: RNA-binding S4 domain-containing protein [Proteobacteria bacterium]|nr:RNA-binding S4 domain-containing protein [Pseudomonadota bacterium]MCH8953244.1 RNA-binding S4 domain-containing protein [Pseudomonadota bacterium]